MNSKRIAKPLLIIVVSFTFFATISCSTKTEAQVKLGADSDYFAALQLLEQGKETDAISKFKRCVKKGTYYCAKESAKKLCEFGSLQQKNEACINLLQQFMATDTLLLAVQQFKDSNEISKIIEYTENLEFKSENNEIIRIRLEALKKRNDSRYEDEVYKWFTTQPLTTEHYQFYRDFYDHPDFETENVVCTPRQFALNYRIELYKRNYTYTFQTAAPLLNYFSTAALPPCPQLASDLGKSYLYGSMNFANNAALFKQLASQYTGTPVEFYFWFYAGRLYEKAGTYYSQTQKCFNSAIETAQTPDQKDTALWYLLNSSLNVSLDSIINSLESYAKQWSDPYYFDDFLSTLISSLLIAGKWTSFYDIYTTIDGYASNEMVAQFAYIYARLVQEGLVTQETSGRDTELDIRKALNRALKCDSAIYYKILAAQKLNVTSSEFEKLMAETSYNAPQVFTEDTGAKNILEGCVLFGFPQMIYPLWLELYDKGISTDTAFYLSDFLQKCSDGNDDYYQQSLRIASKAAARAERPLKIEELLLLYPQNYLNFVDTYCKKYDIKKSVVFALIRSESFFDPDVTSVAGATGLTQLMDLTGGDIARKLKFKDYSLEDPETNIEFGTYYLSELVRRCEGSYLQSFFSYNAGITRVRRWLQSSLIEFGKKKDMPLDLFLETIPYTETREYGRKLISAGVMYELLYNEENLSYQEIVNNLVK